MLAKDTLRSVVLAVSALVAFSACDDGGGGSTSVEDQGVDARPDSAPTDATVDSAVDAGDALPPDGAVCDCGNRKCEDGQCVNNEPCGGDDFCVTGFVCEAQACVAGCASDVQCGETNPAFPLCVEGRCGDCRVDDDCAGGQVCSPTLHRCEEPAVCATSADCLDDRVCVEGEAACQAPFDCRAGSECPGTFTCGDGGECAPIGLADTCSAASDCRLGQLCLGRPARCADCAVDADCAGDQTCEASAEGNRCVEPTVCRSDSDCLFGRTCERQACASPVCDQDDSYEGNDSREAATSLDVGKVYRGLISCNPDWYVFSLEARDVATVVLRRTDLNAFTTLVLQDSDGQELGRSETGAAVEAVLAGPFGNERQVYVLVEQRVWSVGAYELELGLTESDAACIDDAAEAGPGDDSISTGRVVRTAGQTSFGAPVSGRLCPTDLDYVCFNLQSRENFSAHLDVVSGDAVVVGRLLDRTGEEVAGATGRWGRTPTPTDIARRASAGTFCLELAAESGSGGYVLHLSAVTQQVEDICEAAELLEIGRDGAITVSGELASESAMSPTCSSPTADGGESVYQISLDQPALLVARAEGVAAGTLGDPVVSIRSACTRSETEIGCSVGSNNPEDPAVSLINPAEVRVPVEAGDYAIVVDGVTAGARPEYNLSVQTLTLAPAPRNDRCGQAQAISVNGAGEGLLTVDLGQASDDVVGCMGQGGPDAVYRLVLRETSHVQVLPRADFGVVTYLASSCGDVGPTECGFGFEAEVPAGEWFLIVDGLDANARGEVSVDVRVRGLGGAPDNEVCAFAEELPDEGGVIQGSTDAAEDDLVLAANNRCTGFASVGGDVVYSLDVEIGTTYFVKATPTGGWDLSLYVVTDCGDLVRSCVEGSDGALEEVVTFLADSTDTHYIVVDGSGGEHGAFTLAWGVAECTEDGQCGQGHCVDFACVP